MATKQSTRTTRSLRASSGADEGPRYRALSDSVIDNAIKPAGAEFTYYGEPGSQLYPLNAEAKARKAAVRDIRRNPDLDADEKLAALKDLSDEWNGVEDADAFADGDEFEDDRTGRRYDARNTKPLPDAQRAELEKHTQASVDATREAEEDNTNKVRLQLQGDPTDPEGRQSKAGLQGNTPVLDGKASKTAK